MFLYHFDTVYKIHIHTEMYSSYSDSTFWMLRPAGACLRKGAWLFDVMLVSFSVKHVLVYSSSFGVVK